MKINRLQVIVRTKLIMDRKSIYLIRYFRYQLSASAVDTGQHEKVSYYPVVYEISFSFWGKETA